MVSTTFSDRLPATNSVGTVSVPHLPRKADVPEPTIGTKKAGGSAPTGLFDSEARRAAEPFDYPSDWAGFLGCS